MAIGLNHYLVIGAILFCLGLYTVLTRRNDTYYVHVLDYVSDWIVLQDIPDLGSHARLLRDNTPLTIERRENKTLIAVPPEAYDPYDTVVEMW